MAGKFSFCSNFYVDVIANINLLHIIVDLKTVFILWNMILKLKYFIQIGIFIFQKTFLALHIAVHFFGEIKYSTSKYYSVTKLWIYNTQKYSQGGIDCIY